MQMKQVKDEGEVPYYTAEYIESKHKPLKPRIVVKTQTHLSRTGDIGMMGRSLINYETTQEK
jgi:hypothetical protein